MSIQSRVPVCWKSSEVLDSGMDSGDSQAACLESDDRARGTVWMRLEGGGLLYRWMEMTLRHGMEACDEMGSNSEVVDIGEWEWVLVGLGERTVVLLLVDFCWKSLKMCGTKRGRERAWGWFDTIFD